MAASLIQPQVPSVPTPDVEQNITNIYGSYLTFDLGTQNSPHNYFSLLYIRFNTIPYTIQFLESNDNSIWTSLGLVTLKASFPMEDRTPVIFNYTTSTKRYFRMVWIELYIGYSIDILMETIIISYNNQTNLFTSHNQVSASSDFNMNTMSGLRLFIVYQNTYNVSSGRDTRAYYIGNSSTSVYYTKTIVYPTQIPLTFLAPTPLVKDIYHIIGSTINASTLNTQTMNASTMVGNTIQANTLQLNTLTGNTVQTDTLSGNTIVSGTVQGVTRIVGNLISSNNIQTSALYYNTLVCSTFSVFQPKTLGTNTIDFFDYKTTLIIPGAYLTFDLGTGGNTHNRFSHTYSDGSSLPLKIHFLESDDNTTWSSLGVVSVIDKLPIVGNTTVIYSYTSSTSRYLRAIFIETYSGRTFSINLLWTTISNNNGSNLYVTTNQITSTGFTLSITFTRQMTITHPYDYSPVWPANSIGTYTGTIRTIAYTRTLQKYTGTVALTTSNIQTNTLQVNSLIGSTIQTNILQANSVIGSTLQADTLQANTLRGSTIEAGVLQTSTIIGNTIQPILFIASTIFGSTMQAGILQVSTLYVSGVASTVATVSTIQANLLLFSTITGNTIQANTYSGSTITASTMQINQFNIGTLTTSGNTNIFNGMNINTLTGNAFVASTVRADTMNINSTLVGSTIQTNAINGNIIIGNTIQTDILQVSTLLGNQLVGNAIQSTRFNISSITGSTVQANVLQVSTLIGSTVQLTQLNVNTILGSTIQMTQLNTSSIVSNTIQTNVLAVSTVVGSTIQVATLEISTIAASTIRVTTYLASTISGSTVQANTIQANMIYGSSMIGSTLQTPQMAISTLLASTLVGNNFQANKIVITDGNNALSTSVTNASQLQYITNLSSQVSKTGQSNEWTAVQTFSTSSIYFSGDLYSDLASGTPYYTLGLNASNQLVQNIISETSGGLTGVLTAKYIPYATDSSDLSDSIIYRVNATDLAIGQTTSAFPKVRMFNYTETQRTFGEYLTIDLGMGGNYHNRYTQEGDWGWSWIKKINFFGSNDGLIWVNLGESVGIVTDHLQIFNYTSTNNRYLRIVFIEVYNIGEVGLVNFYNCTISNNGGTSLFPTTYSGISLSPNITRPTTLITNINNFNINIRNTYSPTTYFSIGYYIGTNYTVQYNSGTGTATVSVAGLTQTTSLIATSGTFSKIFMADKRSGLNGTVLSGNNGCNFYLGTMGNNGLGNNTDTLYLNSWGDGSAGNVNIVMFNKSTIGMRIYQGAVGAASNFTTYADAVMTDVNSQNIVIGAGSNVAGITFGPNASWASYLKVGSGDNRVGSVTAQVITTNGDLHLTSADNVRGIYLNFYVKDAASTYLYSYTPLTHNNSLTVATNVESPSITTADWYYITNSSAGMYWSTYGRGITSPEGAGNSYGNAATTGTGRNSWSGWGLETVGAYMGVNNEFGIHCNNTSWLIYCSGTSERLTYLAGSVRCGQTENRFEVYFNGYNHSNGYFYINSNSSWSASDERIKKNIKPIDPNISVNFINGIIPSYFCLKEAEQCTQKKTDGTEETIYPYVCSCEQTGFIAQNVLEITKKVGLPKSIVNNWHGYEQELLLPETERKTILGVNEAPLVCHLVNALKARLKMLKEQQEQIRILQHKLETSTFTLNNVRETVRQQTELLQQLQTKI